MGKPRPFNIFPVPSLLNLKIILTLVKIVRKVIVMGVNTIAIVERNWARLQTQVQVEQVAHLDGQLLLRGDSKAGEHILVN